MYTTTIDRDELGGPATSSNANTTIFYIRLCKFRWIRYICQTTDLSNLSFFIISTSNHERSDGGTKKKKKKRKSMMEQSFVAPSNNNLPITHCRKPTDITWHWAATNDWIVPPSSAFTLRSLFNFESDNYNKKMYNFVEKNGLR